MKLSIVIVNYNVKYFLEQCLISVQDAVKDIQNEIFVVDNNSVDDSLEMLYERFPDIHIIANKENVGFSKANNQAIRLAKGEYILLLNPDTVVEHDTFKKMLKFMDEHPDAGGLGIKMVDGKGNFLPESKRSLPTPAVSFYKIFGLSTLFPKSKKFGRYHLGYLDNNQTHEVEILAGACMLMRKEALDKVGLLDETFFMYGEDIDLSYRIILGGYKNYYYPEARIIHYKGESTKKGSMNYVYMFYNAMIIFAKKHFSGKNLKLYSFLINCAIYFRAFIAIVQRFFKKIILPLIDAGIIYLGFLLIKHFWELTKFGFNGIYPDYYDYVIVPAYVLVWLIFIYLSGGYDKPLKLIRLVQGVLIGTIAILVVYALLPDEFRHSRFMILLGTVWATIYLLLSRLLLSKIKNSGIQLAHQAKKRIAIIGSPCETERVNTLLDQTGLRSGLRMYVYNDDTICKKNSKCVGNISQIDEIIHIHKIDELIFCAKDISAKDIIDMMASLRKYDLEYKIAPEESISIIGSNSINTSGELYVVDINTINKPANKRNKRILDILFSIFFLIFSPILIFIVKKPLKMFSDIFTVMVGAKSWVGYDTSEPEYYEKLPKIKKGILSPVYVIDKSVRSSINIAEINLLYAKNYMLSNDVNIIFKGIRYI
ncbi:MAG: glycosyltransferase family 2 protein [Bacteroidales bacterium]|jgi:GT2 family glycosyltransferase/lipopolysaccharide/colanic/teichoic acid biosynthesis glycosyltransferase|nr:glycosyltransferase family 2 protein [Bacteroidales bacterium]